MKHGYALITATWNEEKYIRHTIDAVLNQTILPSAWVIVSDGSTDGTDEIVKEAAANHAFIVYVRKERIQEQKGFASKVCAIQEGLKRLTDVEYSFIGHLDGDVSFESYYYEKVLESFAKKPRLGICGGFIHEKIGSTFRSRTSNTLRSVAGAIQLFRKRCYEDIGGLIPLRFGGEDWYTETMARMKGWDVEADPNLIVFHHKRSLRSRGVFAENFRQGLVDYSLGSHPAFELVKCARRVIETPYFLGAAIRLMAFCWAFVVRLERPVPQQFKEYLRREQLARLWALR